MNSAAADTPHSDVPFYESPPPSLTDAQRQEILDYPVERCVCLQRLEGSLICGKGLHDMPNDQHSVVIWEFVEEVIKDAEGREISCPLPAASAEFPVQSSKFQVADSKSADNETLNFELGTLNSLLSAERRQELFRQVGKEGHVVLTRDGQAYSGYYLSDCGLVQRGKMFLRELCHSTPPWGESPWNDFKPRPR